MDHGLGHFAKSTIEHIRHTLRLGTARIAIAIPSFCIIFSFSASFYRQMMQKKRVCDGESPPHTRHCAPEKGKADAQCVAISSILVT